MPQGDKGFVVVLTALGLEYGAVRERLTGRLQRRVHRLGTVFEIGQLQGVAASIVLGRIGEGNISAAALATRAIEEFSARAVVFVGVAGAVKDGVELGDVVVATRIYAVHSGKEENDRFLGRPRTFEAPHALLDLAEHLNVTRGWSTLGSKETGPLDFRVHFKPIAAGEVVLNSRTTPLALRLHEHYNDVAAIEMESAGIAQAAHLSNALPALTVRGISDKTDGLKRPADDGTWQTIAANHAAIVALAIIREWIDSIPSPSSMHDERPPKGPVERSRGLQPTALAQQNITADGHGTVNAVQSGTQNNYYLGAPDAQTPETSTSAPVGIPLDEVSDPFVFEVHQSISVGGGDGLQLLPLYIRREHDARLAEVVAQAADGRSVVATLVGGSSTGKTRACWEAIRAVDESEGQLLLAGWRLWHPLEPSRPDAVLRDLERVEPRTVIWLNEAQLYLHTPGSDIGERVAARLRAMLRDAGPDRPVLVLATIWEEYWTELTREPRPGDGDPHRDARALLVGTSLRVPAAFGDQDLEAAHAAAGMDARLAHALEGAHDGHIAQYLAAGPALIERYQTAPVGARALIEAAMDARRLGSGLLLPQSLLERAAAGYLTEAQWDNLADTWPQGDFEYATAAVRGARGALVKVFPYPGQPPFSEPMYKLADYLEQQGRETRRTLCASAVLWDALLELAVDRDLLAIAGEAQARGLPHLAIRFYSRAAQAGYRDALREGAQLLEERGRGREAAAWFGSAAAQGDQEARDAVEDLRQEARGARRSEREERRMFRALPDDYFADEPLFFGMRESALAREMDRLEGRRGLRRVAALYQLFRPRPHKETTAASADRRAEQASNPGTRAFGLMSDGHIDKALTLYQRAIKIGGKRYLEREARLCDYGHIPKVLNWTVLQAQRLNASSRWMGDMLWDAGHLEQAMSHYRQTENAGALFPTDRRAVSLRELAAEARGSGKYRVALAWLVLAADNGDPQAFEQVDMILRDALDALEAAAWFQPDGTIALPLTLQTAELFANAEEAPEGVIARRFRADEDATGSSELSWSRLHNTPPEIALFPLSEAAELVRQAGGPDETVATYLRELDLGAAWRMADALRRAGRLEAAAHWYLYTARLGGVGAMKIGVKTLLDAQDLPMASSVRLKPSGELGAAIYMQARWLREIHRIRQAADLIHVRGTSGGAERLSLPQRPATLDNARDDNLSPAYTETADTLRSADRIDKALATLQERARAGDVGALEAVPEALRTVGRIEEALDWYQYASETAALDFLDDAADMLQKIGRIQEAVNLRRYGWEPGGALALPWTAPVPSLPAVGR